MIESHSLLLIFNHRLTLSQKALAQDELHVNRFVSLPPNLQTVWAQISPNGLLSHQQIRPFIDFIEQAAQRGDYVLIQGEFGATFILVDYCMSKKLQPVYSTTHRTSSEVLGSNGILRKESCFQHVNFRKYKYYHQLF